MTEPDVTLTDYALALECGLFAIWLWRSARPGPLRGWGTGFFAAASAAPLLGGTVHGFFLDEASWGHAWLWPATLLSVGCGAFCALGLAATLAVSRRAARRGVHAAGLGLAVYAIAVVAGAREFWIAILAYVPATLVLMAALLRVYRRRPARPVAIATAGLGVTLVAAGLQQARMGIHPVYFNHNALYHAIQGLALVAIFWGLRHLSGPGGVTRVDASTLS